MLTSAGREAGRARRAHHPGPADGEGQREVDRVHAGQGLPLRGAGRDRQRPRGALQGDRRDRRRAWHDDAAPGRELSTAPRSPSCSAKRCGSRTPTSTARSRRSSRSSSRSARSTRRSSASRTSGCWRRVKPATTEPVRRIDANAADCHCGRARLTVALPLALGACGGEEVVKADDAKARTAVHTDFDAGQLLGLDQDRQPVSAAGARNAVHLRGPLQPRAGPAAPPRRLHGHGPHQGDRRRGERGAVGPRLQRRQAARGRARLLVAGRRRERVADGRVSRRSTTRRATSRPPPTPGSPASTGPAPGS